MWKQPNTITAIKQIPCVVVGKSGVGKTNLLRSICYNLELKATAPTIGFEMFSCWWREKEEFFKINFWDTSGEPRFKHVNTTLYKNNNIVVCVDLQTFCANDIIDIIDTSILVRYSTTIFIIGFNEEYQHDAVVEEYRRLKKLVPDHLFVHIKCLSITDKDTITAARTRVLTFLCNFATHYNSSAPEDSITLDNDKLKKKDRFYCF